MIFVTVGTHEQQFDRLVRCVDRLKAEGKITEEVMIQTGFSSYEPKACKWSKLCSYQEMNEYMDQGSDVSQDYSRHTTARFDGPEESVEKEELTKVLGEALELLTEKEKKVVTLYYYEDLTLKEISNILEVSESRVSQLHTKGLSKMKKKLGNYMGILHDTV